MGKTFLYRLFGVGKIPAPVMSELQGEGALLMDEGFPGSVTYRNFHSPGRRSSWERRGFTAALALTKMRLYASSYTSTIINVPLVDERIKAMRYTVEDSSKLCVAFDAGLFHTDWSGTIEYRFSTSEARHFLELLQGNS